MKWIEACKAVQSASPMFLMIVSVRHHNRLYQPPHGTPTRMHIDTDRCTCTYDHAHTQTNGNASVRAHAHIHIYQIRITMVRPVPIPMLMSTQVPTTGCISTALNTYPIAYCIYTAVHTHAQTHTTMPRPIPIQMAIHIQDRQNSIAVSACEANRCDELRLADVK